VTDPGKAVFLGYASQDAGAAQQLCNALRAAGIEVWFDRSELRGGDAWDQKIRREIRECSLAYFFAGEGGPTATRDTELTEESFPPDLELALANSPPHQIRDDGIQPAALGYAGPLALSRRLHLAETPPVIVSNGRIGWRWLPRHRFHTKIARSDRRSQNTFSANEFWFPSDLFDSHRARHPALMCRATKTQEKKIKPHITSPKVATTVEPDQKRLVRPTEPALDFGSERRRVSATRIASSDVSMLPASRKSDPVAFHE
jgi:hypothetical protein